MRTKKTKIVLSFFLTLIIIISHTGFDSYAVSDISNSNTSPSVAQTDSGKDEKTVSSRFLELIIGRGSNKRNKQDPIYVYPGGEAFGVKISSDGLTVTKIVARLPLGELHADDIIISIDGTEIDSILTLKDALNNSHGAESSLEIIRSGKRITERIIPIRAGDEYHLGVILTDVTSGIGTITYINPSTGTFGGLGHGILDKCKDNIITVKKGIATSVILGGAVKGKDGIPGELRGILSDRAIGTVTTNTECGIFGVLNKESIPYAKGVIECANRADVKCGDATIITTVKSGKCAEYSIKITDIDYKSNGTKSFRIKVTDDTLITLTGGIVRGMSGSPIIQDGKLVGAVTHVLINDPTTGYGIFIENMLNAAQMPMAKAS